MPTTRACILLALCLVFGCEEAAQPDGGGALDAGGIRDASAADAGSAVGLDAGPAAVDGGPVADGSAGFTSLNDAFDGDGPLIDYVTNNAGALPDVARVGGRYRANLEDNTDNVTLHFHTDQGRLDARLVAFPFEVIARNIGVGRTSDSQVAPVPVGETYAFAGIQVHVSDLTDPNSAHVVVGHRGNTHFTIEGKNTVDGVSSVSDVGADRAPLARADIRIVGSADRTLTVYWQEPNEAIGTTPDDWTLYRGTGDLPGAAPSFGPRVYVGLITYAFGSRGVPFVGTCDAIEQP